MPKLLGPALGLVGVVDGFSAGEQAGAQVRQFLVVPDDGMPVPVELRGDTISGVLAEGHRVALAVSPGFDEQGDRTQRPLRLRNLSTGGDVVVGRSGLKKKALAAGLFSLKEITKAVLTALIALGLVSLGLQQAQGIGDSEAPTLGGSALVVVEIVWVLLSALIFYFTTFRRWRWEGGALRVWRFISLAFAGGVVIAALAS
jgi:hypothetical protein